MTRSRLDRDIKNIIDAGLRYLARLWEKEASDLEVQRGREFLSAFFSRKPPEKVSGRPRKTPCR